MKLTRNVGTIDRAVRAAIGLVLVLWAAAGGPVWAWLGVILLATAAVSWCPAYRLIGINTHERTGGHGGAGAASP